MDENEKSIESEENFHLNSEDWKGEDPSEEEQQESEESGSFASLLEGESENDGEDEEKATEESEKRGDQESGDGEEKEEENSTESSLSLDENALEGVQKKTEERKKEETSEEESFDWESSTEEWQDSAEEENEEDKEEKRDEREKIECSPFKEIPLNVSVEITRFQMSLDKILRFVPGDQFSLDIPAKSSVDLCINGKCVAKGELVQIGEILGIRIVKKG